jgi:hypothetical protein
MKTPLLDHAHLYHQMGFPSFLFTASIRKTKPDLPAPVETLRADPLANILTPSTRRMA